MSLNQLEHDPIPFLFDEDPIETQKETPEVDFDVLKQQIEQLDVPMITPNRLVTLRRFRTELVERLLFAKIEEINRANDAFKFVPLYKRGNYTPENTLSPEKLFLGLKVEFAPRTRVEYTPWQEDQSFDTSDPTCTWVCKWQRRFKVSMHERRPIFYLYAVIIPLPSNTPKVEEQHQRSMAFMNIGTLGRGDWQAGEVVREREERNRNCWGQGPGPGGLCP